MIWVSTALGVHNPLHNVKGWVKDSQSLTHDLSINCTGALVVSIFCVSSLRVWRLTRQLTLETAATTQKLHHERQCTDIPWSMAPGPKENHTILKSQLFNQGGCPKEFWKTSSRVNSCTVQRNFGKHLQGYFFVPPAWLKSGDGLTRLLKQEHVIYDGWASCYWTPK